MKKIPITRRQMLKAASFTALSAMASNIFVAAKGAVANGDTKKHDLSRQSFGPMLHECRGHGGASAHKKNLRP